MILIDTSIWIDHLRSRDETLVRLLDNHRVLIHPFIIGEIACGDLTNREELLSRLQDLPSLPIANESEVMYFIEQNQLMGLGIGYIDAHLLAATALAPPAQLWTRDKRLKTAADTMRLAYQAEA